jgi:hypothetical protein
LGALRLRRIYAAFRVPQDRIPPSLTPNTIHNYRPPILSLDRLLINTQPRRSRFGKWPFHKCGFLSQQLSLSPSRRFESVFRVRRIILPCCGLYSASQRVPECHLTSGGNFVLCCNFEIILEPLLPQVVEISSSGTNQ